MSSPSATGIFVGGARLLHLLPKFSVTIMFTIMGTAFGNSATVVVIYTPIFSFYSKHKY